MVNFSPICEWVLRQEDSTLSGVVNNLGDGGGLTRYGIAQTKHEKLRRISMWPRQRSHSLTQKVI